MTDLAGKTAHRYNTNRSAFWRVLTGLTFGLTSADPAGWPSHVVAKHPMGKPRDRPVTEVLDGFEEHGWRR